ncbi:hypothetical protein [Natranaerobius trueperi]|uniref:Lipoprotein n=1 Tax=Natranaerobius trueperi TaxID=759412 RepID=A0A226BUI7_9FIRM|nr:hypothetical protein [Natranaerobius trueperi]OWZ82656.1 hypothetical protein CDO51_12895 [Natranaerobius trueperi]
MKCIRFVFLVFLLISFIFIVACDPNDEELDDLKSRVEELEKEYEIGYNVPTHPDYPILYFSIAESPDITDTPPELLISYGLNKEDELIDEYKDDEIIKEHYGEEASQELPYGRYKGTSVINLRYSPLYGRAKVEENVDGIWEINGEEIPYMEVVEEGLMTIVARQEGGYQVNYTYEDGFGKDEAKEFTKFLFDSL